MAVKLQCPQCGGELPASFPRGTKGVCPGCRKAFDAPRVTAVRSQGTVVRAKAFRPPTKLPPRIEEPESSKRWILALALLLLIVGAGGYFWMKRTPGESSTAPNDPIAAASTPDQQPAAVDANKTPANTSVAKAAPKSSAATNLSAKVPPKDETGDEIATTVPKIHRPAPKVETPADAGPPVPFAEFRVPAPGGPTLKQEPFSKSVNQVDVDLAIKMGRGYLKNNQNGWLGAGGHPLGYTSLCALALLETGTPANDPMIQKAAEAARNLAQKHTRTYEISLAILFLDRLGDPIDEPLIRTLGLRLVAGQTAAHGWNYDCPVMNEELEPPLLKLLEQLRPEGQWQIPLAREQGKALVDLAIPIAKDTRLKLDLPTLEPGPMPKDVVVPFMLGDSAKLAEILKETPQQLKQFAVAQPLEFAPPGAPGDPNQMPGGRPRLRPPVPGRDDNSNSQFALLALWAARRHGLPVERSLLLADQRYAMSQTPTGWGYHVNSGASPAMTCVGLLGLALGHGALLADAKAPVKGAGDPAIERGLEALAKDIGQPHEPIPNPNLYYLWSVERVAMLYQLKTIGGKDWYGWGANHLIKTQAADGSWRTAIPGNPAPPIDTAFALLFLHRSNLVADLTERLQLHMSIQDERK